MNVELAFTPQSHWIHFSGSGAANSNFAEPLVRVPTTLYERQVYFSLRSDTGSNYAIGGVLSFYLGGQIMCQQPWRRSGAGSGGELFFQQGVGTDAIRFQEIGLSQDILPVKYVVCCDKISFTANENSTSGGARPVWFLGVLSKSLW